MIFGNINHAEDYEYLDENDKKCIEFIKNNDLGKMEPGTYLVDGDNIFVIIAEYLTVGPEENTWQAHEKYYDIHYMIKGEERIDLNFLGNLDKKHYAEDEDFLTLEGDKNVSVFLRPGDFLICMPSDGHKTGLSIKKPKTVKKAVFRVSVKR